MNVMGIHSYTHDVGCALCIDGNIVCACEEERLTRSKHQPGIEEEGVTPVHSLNYCLEYSGLTIDDIDMFVHAGWPGSDFMKLDILRSRFRDFARHLDPSGERTQFISHHKAHAASAYYASGLQRALVLSVDGGGDWASTRIWLGEGNDLQKVDEYFLENSLGFMFSRAARLLGLGGFGFGEGKLTALAGYGTPIPNFPQFVRFIDNRYVLDSSYYDEFKKYARDPSEPLRQRHKDFAATVQSILEETILRILQNSNSTYNEENVAMAGGVALNCRTNGRIAALPWVKSLYIQPAANDAGLCVGAVYAGAVDVGDKPKAMTTPFLGPDINSDSIRVKLTHSKLKARRVDNPSREAAQLLIDGRSIAWMQGRLEFGPRALGHRSLLADPRRLESRNTLNTIKQREPWRPIAPSIIAEARKYTDLALVSKNMTTAVPMNTVAREEIPAAVHIDGTARAQFLDDPSDPFYTLVKSFYELTGIPAVLNTSLNGQGEPLCNTIEDGLKFFYTSPTDVLIAGKWVLEK